jgi:hypothetical protein
MKPFSPALTVQQMWMSASRTCLIVHLMPHAKMHMEDINATVTMDTSIQLMMNDVKVLTSVAQIHA